MEKTYDQFIQTCLNLSKQLNPDFKGTQKVVEHLLVGYKGDKIRQEQVIKVLTSELTQSFFDPSLSNRSLKELQLFNYNFSKTISKLLGLIYGKYQFEGISTIYKTNQENSVREIAVKELNEKGYWVSPNLVPTEICDAIINQLPDLNFRLQKTTKKIKGLNASNIQNVKANTIWVDNLQDLLTIPEIQKLVTDPVLLSIIQGYLECIPIHCQSNCWWSINYQNDSAALSKNAQLYHQDKEFIKFVKVFIYLNDVDENNGAHAYVAGSCKDYEEKVDEKYQISSRVSDDFIAEKYEEDKIVYMKGKKGTILLEDTSGFHKGVPVLKGHRLLLQMEYCNSMHFNPLDSFTLEGLSTEYIALSKKYPRLFLNYDNARYEAGQKRHKVTMQKLKINNTIKNIARTVVPKILRDKLNTIRQ